MSEILSYANLSYYYKVEFEKDALNNTLGVAAPSKYFHIASYHGSQNRYLPGHLVVLNVFSNNIITTLVEIKKNVASDVQ